MSKYDPKVTKLTGKEITITPDDGSATRARREFLATESTLLASTNTKDCFPMAST